MKKCLLMMLILCSGVCSAWADEVTIYLMPNSNWKQANAWFAIYLDNGEGTSSSWQKFSEDNEHSGYYKVTADNSTYSKFVLVRMNGTNSDTFDWTNKWDQCPTGSKRIDMPNTDAVYTIEGESWSTDEWGESLLPWNCYFLSDKNSSWQVNAVMNGNGPYTYTFNASEYADKHFAVAKGDALSADGTIKNWGSVVRPTSSENANVEVDFIPTFASYSATPVQSTNGSVWKIPSSINLDVNIEFTYTEGSSVVIKPYFTREISSLGYATFSCSNYDVAVDGATATYITGVGDNNVLTESSFSDGILANTGALLYKEGGGTVTFTPAASTPSDVSTTNKLVAVSTNITSLAQTANGKTNYILTNKTVSGDKTIGFYKANSDGTNSVNAGKAYLALETAVASREFFWFDDESTGISSLNNNVIATDGYYNLNGQRVNTPAKGLYIVNGKKVILK